MLSAITIILLFKFLKFVAKKIRKVIKMYFLLNIKV